jgi:hypothetical protein
MKNTLYSQNQVYYQINGELSNLGLYSSIIFLNYRITKLELLWFSRIFKKKVKIVQKVKIEIITNNRIRSTNFDSWNYSAIRLPNN